MLTQLSTLKARLAILDSDTTSDALITNGIKAVCARFDAECNRTLARTENCIYEFPAASLEICCPCYPIETIARFELKASEVAGWMEQTGIEHLIRRQCVISLASALGNFQAQARVIYTGGYVLPGTAAGPGQTPLPADLEQAAAEQVAYWFQKLTDARTIFGRISRTSTGWSNAICLLELLVEAGQRAESTESRDGVGKQETKSTKGRRRSRGRPAGGSYEEGARGGPDLRGWSSVKFQL